MEVSDSVKGLIAETRKVAEKLENDFIGLQHLLLVYNKFDDSSLNELKLTLSDQKELIRNVKGLKLTGNKKNNFPLTKDLEFVLKNSAFQKWVLGDKTIQPKHLHLAIFFIEPKNKIEYLQILENNCVRLDVFRKTMINIQFHPLLRSTGIAKLFRKILS